MVTILNYQVYLKKMEEALKNNESSSELSATTQKIIISPKNANELLKKNLSILFV